MDAGIYMLGLVIILFSLVFGMFDVNLNSSMKQNLFESVRAANQDALYDLQDDYNARKVLTTASMLEAWLIDFAKSADLSYKELVINFVQIETDPPLYLVYVEGHKDKYVVISGDAYASYYSGATIITK